MHLHIYLGTRKCRLGGGSGVCGIIIFGILVFGKLIFGNIQVNAAWAVDREFVIYIFWGAWWADCRSLGQSCLGVFETDSNPPAVEVA